MEENTPEFNPDRYNALSQSEVDQIKSIDRLATIGVSVETLAIASSEEDAPRLMDIATIVYKRAIKLKDTTRPYPSPAGVVAECQTKLLPVTKPLLGELTMPSQDELKTAQRGLATTLHKEIEILRKHVGKGIIFQNRKQNYHQVVHGMNVYALLNILQYSQINDPNGEDSLFIPVFKDEQTLGVDGSQTVQFPSYIAAFRHDGDNLTRLHNLYVQDEDISVPAPVDPKAKAIQFEKDLKLPEDPSYVPFVHPFINELYQRHEPRIKRRLELLRGIVEI